VSHDLPISRARSVTLAFLLLLLCITLAGRVRAAEPTVELLWPNGAPGALGNEPKDKPTLSVYLPEANRATGAAVAICPGGGYAHLAIDHEGRQIAEWLNSLGVAGFIVDYRHRSKGYGHPAPLEDIQRAIRTVRARSAQWKIDPARIGVIGFSAGGHLALDRRHAFRRRQAQRVGPDPAGRQPSRLRHPLLPGDRL